MGRVLGEEGAEGSQYIGSSVQTGQRAGSAQGWDPGNWPPQPKRAQPKTADQSRSLPTRTKKGAHLLESLTMT